MTQNHPAKRIAIIGGGASGVIAALTLQKELGSNVDLTIFDPAPELASGLAYKTQELSHLLNVPAERMSLSETDPLDFVAWLKKSEPSVFTSVHYPFVPRLFYRRYLQDRFKMIESQVRWIQKVVEKPQVHGQGWEIHSEIYDEVIIATGFTPNPDLSILKMRSPTPSRVSRIIPAYHPFQASVLDSNSIGIIGAGLSALDIWRELRDHGYRGPVHFFSRRGLFPLPSTSGQMTISSRSATTTPFPKLLGRPPREIFRKLRQFQLDSGWDWQNVADATRMQVADIWKSWSTKQRLQFCTHIKPYWEVIRHRVPVSVYSELARELNGRDTSEPQVSIHRARIEATAETDHRVTVTFRSSAQSWNSPVGASVLSSNLNSMSFGHIFVATGSGIETSPLVLPKDSALQCPLGLGYQQIQPHLHFLGPVSKSEHWEITAVPEIRRQASSITRSLSQRKAATTFAAAPLEL